MIKDFNFKKKFGQNFLTDVNLLDAIVQDAKISKDITVVEVGAGAGALTEFLVKSAKKVFAFEIDGDLKPFLQDKFSKTENLELIFQDALKTQNEEINNLVKDNFILVANLPYYITSPLIMKFLNNPKCLKLIVMVQKEVAQRIVSLPCCKDYGVLSVKLNALANCKILRNVSRQLFHPVPQVDSAVIEIVKKPFNFNVEVFNNLVEKSFSMRRKTLQNNLTNGFLSKEEFINICKKLNISPLIRAEDISVEQFTEFSRLIEKNRQ